MRSYLGKAYFEERAPASTSASSDRQAARPQRPHPWFYDAIAQQTENRPVEALRELEEVDRAQRQPRVYRSRLLLDADRAARSASLARIYGDLGFQQLALVEVEVGGAGSDQLLRAPSPGGLLRRTAAPRDRAGERAAAVAALQPINITPIQPASARAISSC